MWDDLEGYDTDNPKHPAWAERTADWADLARKAARENPEPIVNRDLGDETDVAA